MRTREDFPKLILQSITIPRKMPHLTCCLPYYCYFNSEDMWLVMSTRQGGINVVHITFKGTSSDTKSHMNNPIQLSSYFL